MPADRSVIAANTMGSGADNRNDGTGPTAAVSAAKALCTLEVGGLHLENAGRARVVALDKTGTLTVGRPEVVEVLGLDAAAARGGAPAGRGGGIAQPAPHRPRGAAGAEFQGLKTTKLNLPCTRVPCASRR